MRIYQNKFSKKAIKIDQVGYQKKKRNLVYPIQSCHGHLILSFCRPQFSFSSKWLNVQENDCFSAFI